MNLKDIAHISGKSGLYRILKPTRSGVIVESLDDKKVKQVIGTQTRVSVLKEISIYTSTQEGSEPLTKVLQSIYEKYGESLPVSTDASPAQQAEFLESVLPEFDKNRVYNSDIKRLISWYELLLKNAPELFTQTEEETAETEVVAEEKEEVKEEAPKKKTVKKEAKAETEASGETAEEEKPKPKKKK
jgi:hypothetical protein